MLWNLYPFVVWLWPIGLVLNVLLLPIWLVTLWIEIAWNSYVVVNFSIDLMLSPYYCLMAFITVFEAMGSRP